MGDLFTMVIWKNYRFNNSRVNLFFIFKEKHSSFYKNNTYSDLYMIKFYEVIDLLFKIHPSFFLGKSFEGQKSSSSNI